MKKTIKAYAVLLTDKKRFECAFNAMDAAEKYALQFFGAQVVECTITYTVPAKSKRV